MKKQFYFNQVSHLKHSSNATMVSLLLNENFTNYSVYISDTVHFYLLSSKTLGKSDKIYS